jgi:hypothetical protein
MGMRFEPGYLIGMAIQSVPEPQKVAGEVLALRFERSVLWQTFALFCILSTGLGVAAGMLTPMDPAIYPPVLTSPVTVGVIEASLLVLMIFAIFWIGRAFGGTGRFDQAILTVIWLQFIAFLLQLLMLALVLFAPVLAGLVQLFSVAVTFWVLSHFTAVMHGFRSVGLVFAVILLTLMAGAVAFSIFLGLIGLGVNATGA